MIPAFQPPFGEEEPAALAVWEHILTLPVCPDITGADLDHVIEGGRSFAPRRTA